eukprot:m.543658 g.543658  ORF g.543658 m.543658 type:complete len:398 (-) comp22131_c0_seq1:867-2060(-)
MDISHFRCPLYITMRCVTMASVCDVVHNSVVHENAVLRNDADVPAKASELHIANVGAVDAHAAGGGVVEAEQQPQHRRLAAAARPDDGDLVALWDGEAQVLEHLEPRVVRERHVLELDHGRAGRQDRRQVQRRSPRGVVHPRRLVQQAEHGLHVHQRLLVLTVHRPQEVERQRELEQQPVDHDEIADRHRARLDRSAGHQHGRRQRHAENCTLAPVQKRQALRRLDGCGLVLDQRIVVPLRLHPLAAEVFDRLVVEQGVKALLPRLIVRLVHLAADVNAPPRHAESKCSVGADASESDKSKCRTAVVHEQPRHHRHFQRCRNDVKQHGREKEIDAPCAAVDGAAQMACLTRQVIVEVHVEQVGERAPGQCTNRFLCNLCKHSCTSAATADHCLSAFR